MCPRIIRALLCAATARAAAATSHVVDDGDSFGFASLAMRSDLRNASFAAVSNTCNLPEINTAALNVYNEDLVARDAATETPTTAQTSEPTAAPDSDAADRASAVGAAAVALLAFVA